jgi:hypothetical protein
MAFNKSSLAQAMAGNGGFMTGASRGKGKGHKYDLSGAVSGPGFQEPADDPTDPEGAADQTDDAGSGDFKSLTVTPSDNGGFLIECQYADDGSGNVEPDSKHTFEDAQGAIDYLTQKITGEGQGGEGDGSDEADDSGSADGSADDVLG